MKIAINPDGRPRLLDAIDKAGRLAESMDFDVIYSLADRPCDACAKGRSDEPKPSVALVKLRHAGYGSMLFTLCAEHAKRREDRSASAGALESEQH